MEPVMRIFRRRPKPREWEIRVTTPDGVVLDVTTVDLEALWRFGARSTDGYTDLLDMSFPRVHLWVKPAGWTEPDRISQLEGTAALPEWMRR